MRCVLLRLRKISGRVQGRRQAPGEGTAAQGSDEAAIAALAEHLGVAPKAVKDWLNEPQVVPSPVLLGWVRLWHRQRR